MTHFDPSQPQDPTDVLHSARAREYVYLRKREQVMELTALERQHLAACLAELAADTISILDVESNHGLPGTAMIGEMPA